MPHNNSAHTFSSEFGDEVHRHLRSASSSSHIIRHTRLLTLFFVRIWQPVASGILFLNNQKNQNWPWTAVYI